MIFEKTIIFSLMSKLNFALGLTSKGSFDRKKKRFYGSTFFDDKF